MTEAKPEFVEKILKKGTRKELYKALRESNPRLVDEALNLRDE